MKLQRLRTTYLINIIFAIYHARSLSVMYSILRNKDESNPNCVRVITLTDFWWYFSVQNFRYFSLRIILFRIQKIQPFFHYFASLIFAFVSLRFASFRYQAKFGDTVITMLYQSPSFRQKIQMSEFFGAKQARVFAQRARAQLCLEVQKQIGQEETDKTIGSYNFIFL